MKIKKLFKENKVLFCLACIIIVSLIIIIIKMFTYFYNGNGKDKYGTRLREIKAHQVESGLDKKIMDIYKTEDGVKSVTYNITGKIIYINYVFNSGVAVDKAKEQVNRSLEVIGTDTLGYYDIQFILTNDNKEEVAYPSFGYKNSSNESIVWTNYNTSVGENSEEE